MGYQASYSCLLLERVPKGLILTFNRPDSQNSITAAFIEELDEVLSLAAEDGEVNYLLLRGSGESFCSGLDFASFAADPAAQINLGQSQRFMDLLKRLSQVPRIVIAVVEGRAMAGGVGIAAACDLIYASPRSSFLLSEALWGLLPCCVTPFLIRRVGYQRAYRMTLTTTSIEGTRACEWGLVDELADPPEQAARRALPRLARLDPRTIGDMKRFFRRMYYMDDVREQAAVAEIERLLADRRIQGNIEAFVRQGALPWQS